MDYEDAVSARSAFRPPNLIRILHTYWRSIALITAACVMVALGWSLLQAKTYSSTATGLVVPIGEDTLSSALAGDNLAQSKAVDYGSLATSRPFAEAVIAELGLDASPAIVLQNIDVTVPEDTVEVRVTAEGTSPEAAANLADAWVATLGDRVGDVETVGENGTEATARVTFQPLYNAGLPAGPSSPQLFRNVVLGALGGLFIGLLYAFARHAMDRRIWSLEQIRQEHGLPVLGIVPKDRRLGNSAAVVEQNSASGPVADDYLEALRELRTSLSYVSADAAARIVVVTSPGHGEGRSTLTANLAAAIASTGQSVVVVDGDLRRPAMSEFFGCAPGVGVAEVLAGEVGVGEALQESRAHPGLRILSAGRGVANPTELLSSGALLQMFESLAAGAAVVLVDSPPVLSAADAALLTASADAALIVAAPQRTTTDELSNALDKLHQVRGNVIGVVLNQVPTKGLDAASYGYYSKAPSAS